MVQHFFIPQLKIKKHLIDYIDIFYINYLIIHLLINHQLLIKNQYSCN